VIGTKLKSLSQSRYQQARATTASQPKCAIRAAVSEKLGFLGGFYIVEAEDLDAALAWGSKTAACIMRPIEVRPFMETAGA